MILMVVNDAMCLWGPRDVQPKADGDGGGGGGGGGDGGPNSKFN